MSMHDDITGADERRQLEHLITWLENAGEAQSDDARRDLEMARQLLDQVGQPVRIAVAGKQGAGKSSIVNLLSGADILPVGQDHVDLPPVVLKYAAVERTVAGWWDRADVPFDGIDLTRAMAEKPDIITLEIDCDALRDIWLVDIPALDDKKAGRAALFALATLADMMIWCSDVTLEGNAEFSDYWRKIPPTLCKNAVVSLTHVDRMDGTLMPDIVSKLQSGPAKRAEAILPIATLTARAALDAEDDRLWEESGAGALVTSVLDTAERIQSARSDKVRRLIAAHGLAPVPTDKVVAEPLIAQPDETPGDPGLPDTLRARWASGIRSILARVESGEIDSDAMFVDEMRSQVSAFLEVLTSSDNNAQDLTGLIVEFERAENLLVLFQYEELGQIALDTARIVQNLSDTVTSWA
ncbi:dynamin family protein [Roseovarius aestuarii]|uniref:Dynamin family protein n=1 Tax=Roseovarius aestuarii TaxID=475083 RepID=A0A1X7BUW0_9RHOB|nr:dynamin family protein [Roseovarius aestuarii]SMC13029.1 Dynamin family protein [Roseovarius aestuarii]